MLRVSLPVVAIAVMSVSASATPPIAMTNVTVLPMTGDTARLPNHTVIVEGDRIVRVGPANETIVPDGARIIDGRGRFLMPGLCDMHVHIEDATEITLYGAYGITTVLNMRGLPCHLRWRDEIAAGDRFGPTLYTTGDYVDGYPASMSPMMSLADDEAIRAAIKRQAEEGYDLVKVYSELTAEQLAVVGEAARRHGLAVTGHTSDNYSLEHALGSGQINVAHTDQLFRFLDGPRDEARERQLARALRDANATVTTSIAIYVMNAKHFEDLEAILAQPEARRLHPALLQPWRRENHRFLRRGQAEYERQTKRNAELLRFTKVLHEEGVPLLLGTDASTVGAYPGWSVYEELHELVAAGLSPAEALATATSIPGAFVRRHIDPDAWLGAIRAGYRADLVLLEDDPLRDVDAVRRPIGVMLRGDWHPRADLDSRLRDVEQLCADLTPAVLAFEGHIRTGDLDAARVVFDEARRRHPGAMLFQHYWLYFYGFAYLYDGRELTTDPEKLRDAVALYEMYAQTFPDYHSAHSMLGRAYAAAGRGDDAASAFRRALAIAPGYAYAEAALAELIPVAPDEPEDAEPDPDESANAPAAASPDPAPKRVQLPAPEGPHPVGTVTYEWQDPTRRCAASPHGGDLRTIVVQIWYPAANADAPNAPYSALSADYRHVDGNARLRPPFAAMATPSPLVVISPGRGVERYGYTTIAEELASRGYVVASVDMPELGWVIYADGLVVRPNPAFQPSRELMSGPYEKVDAFFEPATAMGLRDLQLAWSNLRRLNDADPSGRLTGRIDVTNTGVFGHSLGGRIAGAFAEANENVRAYISMEGIAPRRARMAGLPMPVAMMCSSGTLPYAMDNYQTLIDGRRETVFMVELRSFGHNSVTDFPVATPSQFDYEIEPRAGLLTSVAIVRDFFDVHLKGQGDFGAAGDRLANVVITEHAAQRDGPNRRP
ncbi:MAG: amidohydrolase family protein [Phycisphaerales bacterium]|nr:amidohydrolase family protein [Phycisphaerales bacterium]